MNRTNIMLLAILVLVVLNGSYNAHLTEKGFKAKAVSDSLVLVELRRYNDILEAQAERIARTPFFDKDSIGIGWRGTLYSKYHRKVKITE